MDYHACTSRVVHTVSATGQKSFKHIYYVQGGYGYHRALRFSCYPNFNAGIRGEYSLRCRDCRKVHIIDDYKLNDVTEVLCTCDHVLFLVKWDESMKDSEHSLNKRIEDLATGNEYIPVTYTLIVI